MVFSFINVHQNPVSAFVTHSVSGLLGMLGNVLFTFERLTARATKDREGCSVGITRLALDILMLLLELAY